MIETVIFDMDGVIIDSEPIHLEIQDRLFKTYDISLTTSEYQRYIGRSSKNMWQELIEKFSLSVRVEEVLLRDRTMYHQRLNKEPDLDAIPGVRKLINSLCVESINLVLASSSSMESIELVLGLFELDHYFDHKISGADLRYSKPHPEIFQVAADMANTECSKCLVIEDSYHGVTAAKRAEMRCVGFQNPHSGNQDLSDADLIIDDFEHLTPKRIVELGLK